jgi:hypothetical protein
MVVESTELIPFLQWLPWATLYWVFAVVCLCVVAVLLGLLVAAVQHGPLTAVRQTRRAIAAGVGDLMRTSPRRVWALTRLAVKESIRRRVVVVFAVFILVLAFAGLFLDPGSPNPARLYLSFVLTATSYLILLLALFLSAFSLPMDIRSRTLHTVVTKPVRSSEIVLGRMFGFTIIGTGLLAVMALVSFAFVKQGLDHTHTVASEDLRLVGQPVGDQPRFWEGRTSAERGHRHQVLTDSEGNAITDVTRGHWHEVTVTGSGPEARYQIGPPRGMLLARVPVYGKIRFRDRDGMDDVEGISVGDEWTYRGYVEGGSPAALIWSFDGINEKDFPDGLPMELTLGVFRTHKGVIERGVYGSLGVRNPENGLLVEVEIFESKEFGTKKLTVPRTISGARAQVVAQKIEAPDGVRMIPEKLDTGLAQKREFDLYEDLVADGKVEIWVRCIEPGQYFGAAQADLYLRAADAPFWLNFIKGYFGIWLQMVLVIGFGVMFSTFLSGAVAMIATLGTLVGGFFSKFMSELARGQVHGGGPVEALYRLLTQENLLSELDAGALTKVMEMVDSVMEGALWVISSIVPAFGRFGYAEYVAYGFDISPDLVLMRFVNALAFLLPVFVAAHFFLKLREVAR